MYIYIKFVQNIFLADSFRNESSGGPYERVTESLTHSIRSNMWIHSVTSQVTVLMNESLNHWLTRFILTRGFIQKRVKWRSLWTSHWIIDSLDSFKHLDSFSNESSDCPYERVTESLTHSIYSNTWIHSVTSHWIIHSLDSFKRLIHSETIQVTVLMNESLNHWLDSFKRLIHSVTSQVTVLMYESLNHWLTWFIQTRGFIR